MSARRPIYIKREWQRIREVEAQTARECAEKYGISPRNSVATLLDPGENAERRSAAAIILASRRRAQDLTELLRAAADASGELVWGIANSLGAFRSRKATRPLLRLVSNSGENPERRAAAIYALGLLQDPRATPMLSRIASNRRETEEARVLAADALGTSCNDHRALTGLLRIHNSPSDKLRFTVINALGNFAPNPIIDEVLRSHQDDAGSYPGRSTIGELARTLLTERAKEIR